jgi:hypothetical protein
MTSPYQFADRRQSTLSPLQTTTMELLVSALEDVLRGGSYQMRVSATPR